MMNMYTAENHATGGSHANLPPGTIVANKYRVVSQCGTGNFARVFECVNIQNNERVALKLLKHGFERDADFECDVLQAINRHDPDDRIGVVKLIERFEWRGHAAITFKLKGSSLRAHAMPMERSAVAVVARDLAEALGFLHFQCRAVHTDLKPENILEEVSVNGSARRWAICDLGSASFYTSRLDTDLITTRPYRAPEVIMNRGWSYAADTWSLGCILYELRTGRKLFDGHSDAAHLDAIQAKLGPIPGALGASAGAGVGMARVGLGGPRRPVMLRDEFPDDGDFTDLLLSLLRYDAGARIKCSDVARHPFITRTKCPMQLGAPTGRSASTWSSTRSADNSPTTMSSLGSRTGSSCTSPAHKHRILHALNPSAAPGLGLAARSASGANVAPTGAFAAPFGKGFPPPSLAMAAGMTASRSGQGASAATHTAAPMPHNNFQQRALISPAQPAAAAASGARASLHSGINVGYTRRY